MINSARPALPSADDGVSDDALLLGFAGGDARAGRELTARLAPRLFAHAARVLGDRGEAEDVVQDCFLRLWKHAPQWETGRAKVSTWCFRVVVNLCTDRLRKQRGNVEIDAIAEPEANHLSAVDQMTERARADALQSGLASLPDRQRQAVVLRHIEGLSNPEIAEIMDISTEAVESLTARGKRRLVSALKGRKSELGYSDAR